LGTTSLSRGISWSVTAREQPAYLSTRLSLRMNATIIRGVVWQPWICACVNCTFCPRRDFQKQNIRFNYGGNFVSPCFLLHVKHCFSTFDDWTATEMFFPPIAETDTTEPVAAADAITSPVWVRVVTHNMHEGIVVLGTLWGRDTKGNREPPKQKTAKYFFQSPCTFYCFQQNSFGSSIRDGFDIFQETSWTISALNTYCSIVSLSDVIDCHPTRTPFDTLAAKFLESAPPSLLLSPRGSASSANIAAATAATAAGVSALMGSPTAASGAGYVAGCKKIYCAQ
jgi:hypothetical protein